MNRRMKFLVGVGVGYSILLVVAFALKDVSTSTGINGTKWNWGLMTFLAIVLYTIASLRQVGATELGARIFLGRPIDQVSSGFVFVPVLIFKLKKETRLIIQAEFPGDPEHIYRAPKSDTSGIIPPGKFPPIRIPFGKPEHATAGHQEISVLEKDPLDMRLIEEVVPIVRFKICDYITFLTTIETTDVALKQMQDFCVQCLSREFGKVTPSQVIGNYDTYNKILTKEVQEGVKSWGIEVESALVKVINFSHDLNISVQKIAEETALGKARVIKAEADKRSAVLKGEGDGLAEKAVLDGRTDGLKKMVSDLGLTPESILGAETARAITNNPGNKTIIVGASGFKELVAASTVFGETLKDGKGG